MRFQDFINEASKTMNVAKVPLDKATAYAEKVFGDRKKLLEALPNFSKNYKNLQSLYKSEALDIPRIKMPVIEPSDMKKFDERLKAGSIDIFKPYAIEKNKFQENVPVEFIQYLQKNKKELGHEFHNVWAENGYKTLGNWKR